MSEHTVYAVASGKGGVGKTTTTVNLGTALAGAGNQVVVIDADIGMANLAGFVSLDGAATTLHDVLADEATIDDALYSLADGISAIPSGTDLESYAEAETEGLAPVVARLRERFDFVLLDVGAGISHETVLPLGLSDGVILVSTPDPASVQDARKTIELTERTDGRVIGLVVTRFRPDGDVSAEAIADQLDLELLGAIPEDDAVRASIHDGTPVVINTADSAAGAAYKRVAARLLGTDSERPASGDTSNGEDEDPENADEESDSDDSDGEGMAASESEVSDAIKNLDDGD